MTKSDRWRHSSFAAGTLMIVLFGFNNCSGHFASTTGLTAPTSTSNDVISIQSVAPRGVSLADMLYSDLPADTKIDALPYFSSHLLPPDKALGSHFKINALIDDHAVLTHTKFNEKDNLEVFIATPSEITIRYESSRKLYGNIKDSMRRFRGLPVPSVDLNGAAAGPNSGDIGGNWIPRVLTKAGTNKPYAIASAVDHYVFTSPNVAGALARPFLKAYHWYEFIPTEFPFPFVRDPSNTVLRLTQQWSACNVEQYEYVIGLGLVAWRAFHAARPGCEKRVLNPDNTEGVIPIDTSEQTRIVAKNFFTGHESETFYRTDGLRFGEYNLEVFDNLPLNTYSPDALFLDDFPYLHTSLLTTYTSVLRPATTKDINAELIRRAYMDFLGRQPKSEELANWESKILASVISLSQALLEIQNSFEAKLHAVYLKHLQKGLDPAGLEFWYGLSKDGYSFEQIIQDIRLNPECKFQCL